MITKSEQCLKCAYLHDCDLCSSRDKILDEVKNNNDWKELMSQYFKNGTFSNNKIIDDSCTVVQACDARKLPHVPKLITKNSSQLK